MSKKPVAALVTALALAPLCAVCVFGAAGLASVFTWISGWLGGLTPVVTVTGGLIAGGLVFALTRRHITRKSRSAKFVSVDPTNRSAP